jgi:hypothetical protein
MKIKSKNLRKLTISALIFAVSILPLQSSFAMQKNNVDHNFVANFVAIEHLDDSSIIEDLSILQKYNLIDSDYGQILSISDIDNCGDNIKEYTIKYGDKVNTISVLNHDTNKTTLQIKQPSDNISNILEIYSDGRMIVDGSLIKVTKSTEITPFSSGSSIYFNNSPGYGSASDYNHYFKQENISDIAFSTGISNFATSVLVAVLFYAMGGIVGFGLGILYNMINEFVNYNPNSRSLSSKSTVYSHRSYPSGYIPSTFSHVYKYRTTFYSKINYGGISRTLTMYKHIMHG